MFLYYICVDLWEKINNEFLYVSFEQDIRKRIYVKSWLIKKSFKVVIYPNFYIFYHKAIGNYYQEL